MKIIIPSCYSKTQIVCLLSLELFILGVQANKLHFCYLELILNKTGYSHIMENKQIFFSFFNMGTSWKKFDPLVFSNFLWNPPEFFVRKWGILKGFNLRCFNGRIIVGGRPYSKLWGKYKKPYPRFHRFWYENPLKIEKEFSKFVFAVLVTNHKDIRESNNNI